jgi:hypothetical protein
LFFVKNRESNGMIFSLFLVIKGVAFFFIFVKNRESKSFFLRKCIFNPASTFSFVGIYRVDYISYAI